jgi:hypothetical protein
MEAEKKCRDKNLLASQAAYEKIMNIARFYAKIRHVGSSVVADDSDKYTASIFRV